MDEQQQQTILALLASYARARADLEDRTVAAVLRLVAAMVGKWYDPKALAGFHADAADIVGRGQKLASDLTGSYVDHALQQMNVVPIRKPLAPVGDVRSIEPAVEWERPAKEFRRLRATGLSELAAQVEAEQRASNLTRMDLRLAERQAARQRMQATGVTGYRRIIHPELSKSGSCGLCVVASDRIYSREDLLPLHNGCECTVLPITAAGDPGLRITQDDLSAIYSAADSTTRDKLQRVRVTVNEHGELGPVLSRKGENFRDAADASHDLRTAASRPKSSSTPRRAAKVQPLRHLDPAERAANEVQVLEKSLANLEIRAKAGEDVSKPLAYQRDRIEQLRRIAAGTTAA